MSAPVVKLQGTSRDRIFTVIWHEPNGKRQVIQLLQAFPHDRDCLPKLYELLLAQGFQAPVTTEGDQP
jgi:hypothetical protein